MRSTLSVMGLYSYDNTVFDALHLPTALETSRECIEGNILVECAELETLFSNPEIFKKILDIWSYKQCPIWEKLYNTTQLVYNPIWNVDGTITETIEIERAGEHKDNETRTGEHKDNETRTGQNSSTSTSGNTETRALGTTDTETRDLKSTLKESRDLEQSTNTTKNTDQTNQTSHAVFAYNSGDESPESVDHTNGHTMEDTESSSTDEGTVSNNGTDTGTVKKIGSDTGTVKNDGNSSTSGTESGETNRNGTESGETNRNGTESSTEKHTDTTVRQGNVGVTTTQSMIREEREVDLFNIVDVIVNDFKNRFCLLVY